MVDLATNRVTNDPALSRTSQQTQLMEKRIDCLGSELLREHTKATVTWIGLHIVNMCASGRLFMYMDINN